MKNLKGQGGRREVPKSPQEIIQEAQEKIAELQNKRKRLEEELKKEKVVLGGFLDQEHVIQIMIEGSQKKIKGLEEELEELEEEEFVLNDFLGKNAG